MKFSCVSPYIRVTVDAHKAVSLPISSGPKVMEVEIPTRSSRYWHEKSYQTNFLLDEMHARALLVALENLKELGPERLRRDTRVNVTSGATQAPRYISLWLEGKHVKGTLLVQGSKPTHTPTLSLLSIPGYHKRLVNSLRKVLKQEYRL